MSCARGQVTYCSTSFLVTSGLDVAMVERQRCQPPPLSRSTSNGAGRLIEKYKATNSLRTYSWRAKCKVASPGVWGNTPHHPRGLSCPTARIVSVIPFVEPVKTAQPRARCAAIPCFSMSVDAGNGSSDCHDARVDMSDKCSCHFFGNKLHSLSFAPSRLTGGLSLHCIPFATLASWSADSPWFSLRLQSGDKRGITLLRRTCI